MLLMSLVLPGWRWRWRPIVSLLLMSHGLLLVCRRKPASSSALAAYSHREKHRITSIDLAALVFATIRLNIV